MLAGITPLGERSRGRSWPITVTTFIVASTLAGLAVGFVAGTLGAMFGLHSLSPPIGAAIMLSAAALGAGFDLRGARIPSLRRQVNAGWMTAYRGWVYGGGFGFQLGLGVSTVVNASATYICILAAAISGDAASGAAIFGVYGLVRGLSVLPSGYVRRPNHLLRLSRTLERWNRRTRDAVVVVQLAVPMGLAVFALA